MGALRRGDDDDHRPVRDHRGPGRPADADHLHPVCERHSVQHRPERLGLAAPDPGVLLLIAGANLLREGAAWARTLGTVLVALSILVQMAWMSSYPLWAIIMIVLDVLVIYALVATWEDRSISP